LTLAKNPDSLHGNYRSLSCPAGQSFKEA